MVWASGLKVRHPPELILLVGCFSGGGFFRSNRWIPFSREPLRSGKFCLRPHRRHVNLAWPWCNHHRKKARRPEHESKRTWKREAPPTGHAFSRTLTLEIFRLTGNVQAALKRQQPGCSRICERRLPASGLMFGRHAVGSRAWSHCVFSA